MSIIVSVYLKEGIVMSADSRLTGITPCKDGVRDQYTVSDNGQKLFLIKMGILGFRAVEIKLLTVRQLPILFVASNWKRYAPRIL